MLDVVAAKGLPVTVCTIYDSVPDMETLTHEAAGAALSLFNDVIIREASARGIPVIDLRADRHSLESDWHSTTWSGWCCTSAANGVADGMS